MDDLLLYTGSVSVLLWGATHLATTEAIAQRFEELPEEAGRVLVMQWVVAGILLSAIGLLTLFATLVGGSENPVTRSVCGISAATLALVGISSRRIGGRTSIARLEPRTIVTLAVAILLFLGSVL